MKTRRWLGGWWLIVLALHTACATGPLAGDLQAETPSLTLPLKTDFAPVQVSPEEFREAFTRLLLEVPLRVGSRSGAPPMGRVVRASWMATGTGALSVEEGYARLCEQRGAPGDCFLLSRDSAHAARLRTRDRFALGLILALRPAMEAAVGAFQDFSAQAMTSLLSGLSLYLLLLLAPEPISKGLALVMTGLLWAYLGTELWTLISATVQLWEEAQDASTFHELNEASRRYAQVLGPNTLNVLILLATWKAGAIADKPMTGGGLPGLPQALQNAASAGRIRLLTAVSEAETVSVAGGQLTITLPSASAAVLAMQSQDGAQEGPIHHIATVKNEKSSLRGGPWTQKLKVIFDKAGMSMEDPANKLPVPGHKGPHPEKYHLQIYTRLKSAVSECETTAQCRDALISILKKLAAEIGDPDSELNKLLTQKQ